MLTEANTKAADTELSSRHVHQGIKVSWHNPCIISDLPRLNLPHTMQIGMIGHSGKWIFHFMKMHKRLNKNNAIWLPVPAYQDITPRDILDEELSQWNGKEMKEMSRYLLRVVTQSLRGGSPAQHRILNNPIECPRALLKVYMYARYNSHDDATLSYMEDPLHCSHSFKDVFFLRQAGNKSKIKTNALTIELVKKQNVDKDTTAENWTPYKRQRKMNAWRDYISHEIDGFKELDAKFNFPKIHLMSHWVQQITRYGARPQYSAKWHQHTQKR